MAVSLSPTFPPAPASDLRPSLLVFQSERLNPRLSSAAFAIGLSPECHRGQKPELIGIRHSSAEPWVYTAFSRFQRIAGTFGSLRIGFVAHQVSRASIPPCSSCALI